MTFANDNNMSVWVDEHLEIIDRKTLPRPENWPEGFTWDGFEVRNNGCYITTIFGDEKDVRAKVLEDNDVKFLYKYNITKCYCYRDFGDSDSNVACVGFCEDTQEYWGWSHRACNHFGIGHITKEGDCETSSGYIESYLKEHPEKDYRIPVGFVCETLADCKRVAFAFASSVS